jgi:uncharacterized protein YjbJ (UPF0337 family)
MTEDRIEGGVKKEFGRLQEAMGRARGDIGQQAQGKFNEATGAAQEVAGHVREVANDLYEEFEAYAQEKPLLVGAALLGLGVAIGLAMRGPPKTIYVKK